MATRTDKSAYLIGAHSTIFGKLPHRTYKDLTREAYLGALADAQLPDGAAIETAWFGNCTMHLEGQSSVRGQVCMTPLVREGLFPERVSVINVENACATASSAMVGAYRDILAGASHLSLVIGVEKLIDSKTGKGRLESFGGGMDRFDPQDWISYYEAAGATSGKRFELGAGRSPAMDTYAMQACYHMKRYGTTREQMAIAAAKTHCNGALNPRAQYRFKLTPQEVLADREVSFPLTRSMCAPIGDGAAALLLCSDEFLRDCAPRVRERAVRIRGIGMSGGKYRGLDEPSLSSVAAQKAYDEAGVTPNDIHLAEVHDATSFSEIFQAEMMGFCPRGEGGRFIESGAAHLGGRLPLNTSGGLVSKGHPIGATGASMICELMEQLRGEAGERQVPGARLALAENGGGIIGFDEAVCVVTILERS